MGQTAVSFPEVQQEALAHDATHRDRESDRNLDVINLRCMRVFKRNSGILIEVVRTPPITHTSSLDKKAANTLDC